jgi:uncharacterized protein (DUF362 family)
MDRREFLRDAAAFSAGAAAAPVIGMGREALAAETAAPVVAVAEGKDWAALPGRTLGLLGGMGAFVKQGAKVFIKPNASFDRTPEQGANVHPDVLKSVVKLCLDAGAARVILFDRTLAEERRCYVNSGIGAAIEEIGDPRVSLERNEDRKFVPVKIDRGVAFNNWQFFKDALDCDAYINVAVAKHHNSARLTMGLKNVLGIIGGNRGKIHWSLDQGIVDLNTVARPKLTIIDATRIMIAHGPGGGNLDDVKIKNTLIASADIVAADSWCAKNLFNVEPGDIPYIKIANATGLGQSDLAKIKVLKA